MVQIITDTTSGIPSEIAHRYSIPIIPQIINFGNESFYEGDEMSNAMFMQRLKTSPELPKTAAPPPELFVEEFKRLLPKGEPILCIHPSAEVSGTVRSATVAAMDFPDADIRIIDTRTIGSALATLVQLAAEWASQGDTVDIIENKLKAMIPRSRIYFLVATLEFLARGGRIGGAAALVGSMLQIKPILIFHNGIVDQFERERTQKRAMARLIELAKIQVPKDGNGYLSVMHASAPDQARELVNNLKATLNLSEIPVLDVPPAIATHGGPGILAIAFFESEYQQK